MKCAQILEGCERVSQSILGTRMENGKILGFKEHQGTWYGFRGVPERRVLNELKLL